MYGSICVLSWYGRKPLDYIHTTNVFVCGKIGNVSIPVHNKSTMCGSAVLVKV